MSGEHYPADAGARLRAPASAGGVTLVGTGMNPMYVPTLALASTAMCREVQSIRVTESLDCVGYASAAMWKGYGFGGPRDTERLREILWAAEPDYREALDQLAGGIGLESMTTTSRWTVESLQTTAIWGSCASTPARSVASTRRGPAAARTSPLRKCRRSGHLAASSERDKNPNGNCFTGTGLTCRASPT